MRQTEVKRFCSCSAVPTHLAGDSSLAATESQRCDQSVADSGAPSHNDGLEHVPTRFCSCSDRPPRVVLESAKVQTATSVAGGAEIDPVRPAATVGATPQVGVTGASTSTVDPPALGGVSELFEGELSLYSVHTHGKGSSEVVLTDRRVLLRGAPDAKVLFSSIMLNDIDSVAITRARPNRRSLVWGLIGIGASVGMWQALDGVGNLRLVIAAIVVLTSALLLADYALRPPDLQVSLRARSGTVMGVDFAQGSAEEADRFGARVIATLEAMRSG